MSILPQSLVLEMEEQLSMQVKDLKPHKINNQTLQTTLDRITKAAKLQGFSMSCDYETGKLLNMLVSLRPQSNILELGTGLGFGTCWLLDAMCSESTLTSVEIESKFQAVASETIKDKRVTFVNTDVRDFLKKQENKEYDVIFADTIYGKYIMLDETIRTLRKGGILICDDLKYQETWPPKYKELIDMFLTYVHSVEELHVKYVDVSSGILVAVKL